MKPLLPAVEAVLFDLDGTLVETNIDFQLMKREMIRLSCEAGVDVSSIEKLDILAIIREAVNNLRSNNQPDTADQLQRDALNNLEEIEVAHADRTTEIPFARHILCILKEHGIKIGIVTRNCRKASEKSMEITGISADVMICREDCDNHKPNPDPLHMALYQLRANAANSIMVGDHIMDIQSGKAAGMKTIGFLRENRSSDFFDDIKPDLVVMSLREALDAIIDLHS